MTVVSSCCSGLCAVGQDLSKLPFHPIKALEIPAKDVHLYAVVICLVPVRPWPLNPVTTSLDHSARPPRGVWKTVSEIPAVVAVSADEVPCGVLAEVKGGLESSPGSAGPKAAPPSGHCIQLRGSP